MQTVVHGKDPQYLKDLMIPSERLHVHGNKQLLPRTRIDIFKTSFSFSGSLAWTSLAHHLRYPMELKTFKRKAFQALAKPLWILLYTSCSFFFFFQTRQTAWHKMYRMLLLFSFPCSCKVLDLKKKKKKKNLILFIYYYYFIYFVGGGGGGGIFMKYLLFLFPCGHLFSSFFIQI